MSDRHIEAIPERWITYTYRTSDENELQVCMARNPKYLSGEERVFWEATHDDDDPPRTHPIAVSLIHPRCPAQGPIAPEGHVQIEFLLTEAAADDLVIRLARGLQMWRGELTVEQSIAAIPEDSAKAKAARELREEG
ncbi:hypothetical protein LCGC14_0500230 [marine sediment metagenome]|uniref:Uncharacterized protein n=1 Tax=marine sediment metagenome TaxID=412755 RepID=A0A0F9S400_9ZZZZ